MQIRHTMTWAILAVGALAVSTATAEWAGAASPVRGTLWANAAGCPWTKDLTAAVGRAVEDDDIRCEGGKNRQRNGKGNDKGKGDQKRDRKRDCAQAGDRQQDRQRKRDRKQDCTQDCQQKQDRQRKRDRKRDCDAALGPAFDPDAFCGRSDDRDRIRDRGRNRDCSGRDRIDQRNDKRDRKRDDSCLLSATGPEETPNCADRLRLRKKDQTDQGDKRKKQDRKKIRDC